MRWLPLQKICYILDSLIQPFLISFRGFIVVIVYLLKFVVNFFSVCMKHSELLLSVSDRRHLILLWH